MATKNAKSITNFRFVMLLMDIFLKLFPLNSSRRLGSQIEENSVNAFYLVGDAGNDLMKHLVGYFLDGCSHSILCVDRADYCGPALVTRVVLYANALDVGNCDEILPNLLGKSAVVEFLTENRISLAERVETVACDRAETTNAKTGAGEGLTVNHSVGKSESLADNSDLVLK